LQGQKRAFPIRFGEVGLRSKSSSRKSIPDKFNVLNDWKVWNELNARAARLVLEPILDQQAHPQQGFIRRWSREPAADLDNSSELG
jgi:hypothetical protein